MMMLKLLTSLTQLLNVFARFKKKNSVVLFCLFFKYKSLILDASDFSMESWAFDTKLQTSWLLKHLLMPFLGDFLHEAAD